MMTMFGTLVQRLTSPVTSPTSPRRRFKSPSRWEVQSDPEDDPAAPVRKSRAKHLLDKRKSKSRARALNVHSEQVQMCNSGWHDAAFPPLRGTKSLGRLDGMKEVSPIIPFEYFRQADTHILWDYDTWNSRAASFVA